MLHSYLAHVFPVLIMAYGLLGLLYFISIKKVVGILEVRFQEEWKSMGRPRFDFSTNIRSSFLLSRYILLGRYEGTGDDELLQHGRRCRLRGIYLLVMFAFMTIIFFLTMWLKTL